MIYFLSNNESLNKFILLLANVKDGRYRVDNLNALRGEILVGTDKFQQLGEYNNFLFLR